MESCSQARKRALDIVYNYILPLCKPHDVNQFEEFQGFKKAENPAYSHAELKEMAEDYVHSMLFAGHESATTTLTFAIKYLSENPQILQEIKVYILQSLFFSRCFDPILISCSGRFYTRAILHGFLASVGRLSMTRSVKTRLLMTI